MLLELNEIRLDSPASALPILAAAVAWDGTLLSLHATEADAAAALGRGQGDGASFPVSRPIRPLNFKLVTLGRFAESVVEIVGQWLAHPLVQLMPDGRVLLVGARCRLQDGVAEKNAIFWSPDTQTAEELTFGDGIGDVQVDSSGQIWVSYFDEGIFGNFGWGSGRPPIGEGGLVKFDSRGGKVWRLHDDEMADCYALNVTANGTWICFYTPFDFVHIARDGVERRWTAGLKGTGPIAVGERHVVSFGGYSIPWYQGTVRELLPDGRTRAAGSVQVPNVAEKPAYFGCRGSMVYVLHQQTWYVADVLQLGL